MKNTIILLALSVLLTGCKGDKSVDYWKQHIDEAKEVKAQCIKDGDDSINCANAKQAIYEFNQSHSKKQTYSNSDFPDVKLN